MGVPKTSHNQNVIWLIAWDSKNNKKILTNLRKNCIIKLKVVEVVKTDVLQFSITLIF
jgi:hypothetical protein